MPYDQLRHRAKGLFIENQATLFKIFNGQVLTNFKKFTKHELYCLYYVLFFVANQSWPVKDTVYHSLVEKQLDSELNPTKSFLRECLSHPKRHITYLQKFKRFIDHFLAPIFVEKYPA